MKPYFLRTMLYATCLFVVADYASAPAAVAVNAPEKVAEKAAKNTAEKAMAKLEKKYQATGTAKKCVSLRFLRDSNVIDNQTIFFEGPGKKAYLNRLPRACSRLAAEKRFSYRTSLSQLCSTDVITVLDSFGRSWGRCGLGEFEVWQAKPKNESAPS
ncbi:MAG: hypothetical protein KUG56_00555 [Kordiimonadaceae bacterium]|nr:hypothetical protein [Kordiimonadaceae bacterium]